MIKQYTCGSEAELQPVNDSFAEEHTNGACTQYPQEDPPSELHSAVHDTEIGLSAHHIHVNPK